VPISYWYCFGSDDNPEIGGLHGLKQIFDEKGMGDRGLLLSGRPKEGIRHASGSSRSIPEKDWRSIGAGLREVRLEPW
jgi:hypothetical protein